MTKSQPSAAASSWLASARFSASTESMSGESSSARPCGSASVATSCSVPAAPGSPVARQTEQDAVALERGQIVRVTDEHRRARRRACRGQADDAADEARDERVDFPAPVEPPTTISAGASKLPQARQQVVVHLRGEIVAHALRLVGAGDVELEPHRPKVVAEPLERPDHVRGP